MTMFAHTDADGDRVTIVPPRGAPALLTATAKGSYEEVQVHLTPDAVDRLREWLKPYGAGAEAPGGSASGATAAPATEIVKGREYRLLPSAETLPGMLSAAVEAGVTRVRVVDVHAGYGNGGVRVAGLDGRDSRWARYVVMPKYLAPLDEPAPLATDDAIEALRAALAADPDRATVIPGPQLNPRRVAAVEKALAIFGASEFTDEVNTADVLAVAAYIAGEVDLTGGDS